MEWTVWLLASQFVILHAIDIDLPLDRLICAKNRTEDGRFVTQACRRWPSAKQFPFCVYMVVP
uniref:Secreted protein n=1 Tax=Heterorhabditis bacteriophora TaxID=37862 RepID=A0A1I7WNG8_HETBA